MEKNAQELSELVSTFNEHVSEQHEKVESIEETTRRAKDEVDEGYKHLVKAESNSKGSTMTFALFIFLMSIVLLSFNNLKWDVSFKFTRRLLTPFFDSAQCVENDCMRKPAEQTILTNTHRTGNNP